MEISFQNIVLISLVLLTGLSAGLCFTWTNAVSPGIGKLDDLGFLQSFQHMNRTILNPLFFVVFFGPFFLYLMNLYLNRNSDGSMIWMLVIVTVLYFSGVVLVTIFGNVPLNELLEKADLLAANKEELSSLRVKFEGKWNRFHLIRTITSISSFLLLLLFMLQISNHN
ncbi:MAG: DUF1772 domain-containing protein [Eudoraea sp.]|nr:DUF1772 domain-containing protein [Eudoraea sp.]